MSLSCLICLTLHSGHSDQFSSLSVTGTVAEIALDVCVRIQGRYICPQEQQVRRIFHPSSAYSAAALLLTLHMREPRLGVCSANANHKSVFENCKTTFIQIDLLWVPRDTPPCFIFGVQRKASISHVFLQPSSAN